MKTFGGALLRKSSVLMSKNRLCMLSAIGLAALVVPQRSANAALWLSIDGGAPVMGSGTIVNSSSVAGFTVTISVASSNSPGSTSDGQISIQSLDITNLSNLGPATLTLQSSDVNFTQPGGPLSLMTLQSSVSGTFTQNDSPNDSISFISYADPANGQPAAVNPTPLITINNAPPSAAQTQYGSFTRDAVLPYSMSDTITVTLAPGDTANITGSTSATASTSGVPEPTLGVVPALALGLLARRRRASR